MQYLTYFIFFATKILSFFCHIHKEKAKGTSKIHVPSDRKVGNSDIPLPMSVVSPTAQPVKLVEAIDLELKAAIKVVKISPPITALTIGVALHSPVAHSFSILISVSPARARA